MAWIRIHNRANYPVNVQLCNAGFVYFYENSVTTYTEFFVADIWWDFDAVFDCDRTKINPAVGNQSLGMNVGLTVLGAVVAAAGVVVTIASLGTAAPVGTLITVGGISLTASAVAGIATATAIGAGALAAANIYLAIEQGVTVPARINNLYGGNDCAIYIDGEFKEDLSALKDKKQITIVDVKPLVVSWSSKGNKQVAPGYSIPD